MKLQLYFDQPACVSADSNKGDLLIIKFNDEELMQYFGQMIETEETIALQTRIGRQLYSTGEKQTVEAVTSAAIASVASVGLISVSLNFILQSSLNQMLGQVKHLQIIVHVMLINVFLVAHAEVFI